jgi:pimeloyl-ACP methyl ester carboxylesterase
MQSPSLKPLQNLPEFENLVKMSAERSKEYLKEEYEITRIPDDVKPPYPFMLALHAGSGFVDEESIFWEKMVNEGYVLGMPRSTNVFWSGRDSAYWPEHEVAAKQIKNYIKKINTDITLDLDRTIVGGLSAGGELSIWLALTGTIRVQKFIVIAPGGQWMNEPEKWQPVIDNSKNRDVKGMIILGEKDKAIPHKSIEQVVDMLNNGGISCKFIKYPGLGHWYPTDFREILSSFIQEKD